MSAEVEIADVLAVQLRGGMAGIEPDVRIGELTDAELLGIATAITAFLASKEQPNPPPAGSHAS